MKFNLEIELENDDMQSPDDVAEALADIAHKLRDLGEEDMDDAQSVIMDVNGNKVGHWWFE